MTTHGPFNWESEHFHYRQVNIWPRLATARITPIWARLERRATRACWASAAT
jgi:hypothetical protein